MLWATISNSVPFGLQVGEGLGVGEGEGLLKLGDGVTLGSEDEVVPPPHAATAIIIAAATNTQGLDMREAYRRFH